MSVVIRRCWEDSDYEELRLWKRKCEGASKKIQGNEGKVDEEEKWKLHRRQQIEEYCLIGHENTQNQYNSKNESKKENRKEKKAMQRISKKTDQRISNLRGKLKYLTNPNAQVLKRENLVKGGKQTLIRQFIP